MKKIGVLILSSLAIFSPIELSVIVLMGMILLDTLVKLISLKKLANREKRKYFDVFQSKMLRHGYIYKSAGYFILALALFPIDYFFLTPFICKGITYVGLEISFMTKALLTNGLLIIFSLIELGSINENWVDISGNNVLKSVYVTVAKIKKVIAENVNFLKGIKK
jgi:hypothetical protein